MAVSVPDNSKKYKQFILTSALNLVFMILMALYIRLLMQAGAAPANVNPSEGVVPPAVYLIAPPAFGLVGLLLAIAWKPLSRGVIVLLALHYILMMSIVLLAGYANVTILLGHLGSATADALPLIGLLLGLVFVFIMNLISLKDLDLPSIFGKR